VASVLAWFSGSNPAVGDGLLRAKIRGTTSFGEEVKPSVPLSQDFTAC
jgi:hypothetical protein